MSARVREDMTPRSRLNAALTRGADFVLFDQHWGTDECSLFLREDKQHGPTLCHCRKVDGCLFFLFFVCLLTSILNSEMLLQI